MLGCGSMYSILDKVDKYMKENDVPFDTIVFDKKMWPYYLNEAILYIIRKYSGAYFDSGCDEYIISYDKDGKIYLLVQDRIKKTKLLINDIGVANVDFKYLGISEERVIAMAHLFKYLNNDINSAKNAIIAKDVSELSKNRRVCLYEAVDELVILANRELIGQGEIPTDKVNISKLLNRGTNNLLKYIDYLYQMYCIHYPENRKKVRIR